MVLMQHSIKRVIASVWVLLVALKPGEGFVPSSLLSQRCLYNEPHLCSATSFSEVTNILTIRKCAKKRNVESQIDSDTANDDSRNIIMGVFKRSPGTIILAPFFFLFGLDIVLNIAVVTKRSLEVFFTGEYTVWTPWQ
mmetsp:Transcript_19528/g.40906  ORF Transcript_19528/g.40906 Transcript_19528/m.40906 type:complete len:138 (-) Transcript_19528:101-514(-)